MTGRLWTVPGVGTRAIDRAIKWYSSDQVSYTSCHAHRDGHGWMRTGFVEIALMGGRLARVSRT